MELTKYSSDCRWCLGPFEWEKIFSHTLSVLNDLRRLSLHDSDSRVGGTYN